ncbi:MAG TPA: hypothetical protein VFA20_17010 [Myxococcaceae bacterium]|nr:hypothetical protein [Myxococcaceae bacterium]
MSIKSPGAPGSKGPKRKPRFKPHARTNQQAQDDARQQQDTSRQQTFDREEGPPEDLAQMLLKLGRRAFAQQAYVRHRLNDYRNDFKKQMLLRAFDGSEERLQMVTERTEQARAQAREYLGKALALGMESLNTTLDVHHGVVSACFDRLTRLIRGADPLQRFVQRLGGATDTNIQHATVRSIILHELVKDILHDRDNLVDKLSGDQRKELFEFALGMREEPPEVVSAFFKDSPLERPPGVPEIRHEQETRVRPIRWEVDLDSQKPNTKLREQWVWLQSELFEERELAIYIGHLVALKPDWWPRRRPWRDARQANPSLRVSVSKGDMPEPSEDAALDEPYRLPMLQKVKLTVTAECEPFFYEHREELEKTPQFRKAALKRLGDQRGAGETVKISMMYRCDISLPTLRCVLPAEFHVSWAVLKPQAPA